MSPHRQPALFVGHGSPMVAVEDDAYTDALARFGRREPRPKAVVVVSAHWEAPAPVRVGAAERPELIYDFGGFPDELYQIRYDCPGDPALARDIVRRLNAEAIYSGIDSRRGLDHGAWIPLRRL
ncbi:MAG: dioxygenase, partial [Elusimicrobia bacterium]|nr:dioxygenase [Elusimicrobiota bacterium]